MKFTFQSFKTAVDEHKSQEVDIPVYFNSLEGTVHITNTASLIRSVSLVNMRGQQVDANYTVQDEILLEASHLPEGLYIVAIDVGNRIIAKKIFID